MLILRRCFMLIPMLAIAFVIGCGGDASTDSESSAVEDHAESGEEHAGHDHEEAGHNHNGWWCTEHGVPEADCALCDSKVAAAFQKKGDWCKEHNRPDSQCFECNPELQGKFASLYEAKFGEKPPAIE